MTNTTISKTPAGRFPVTRFRRTAFTLVEILVVIAIIGILVAILLPAVQAARETARRAQCSYHLSQLIIATHNYESSHRVFPAGVVNNTGPIVHQPKGYHHSWIVQLLPYIGEPNTARAVDFTVGVYDPANAPVRAHSMPMVQCPSSYYYGNNNVASSSYAAVYHDAEVPIDDDNNGVFFRNSFLNHDDITDGLAYTLFYGDRFTDPNLLSSDLGWMSGTRATLRNTGTPLNTTDVKPVTTVVPYYDQGYGENPYSDGEDGSDGSAKTAVKPPPATKKPSVGGFVSQHPFAVQFAVGDGSVRPIAESIDPRTLRLLGNRADGQMIELDY